MRTRVVIVLALGMAIVSADAATSAHHSFGGEFDNTIAVTLQGVVTSVEMVNPHSFIYLDVKTNGAVERWALEGPGPIQVQRRGLSLNFIKAGDELGVCGYLARRDVAPTRPGRALTQNTSSSAGFTESRKAPVEQLRAAQVRAGCPDLAATRSRAGRVNRTSELTARRVGRDEMMSSSPLEREAREPG